MPFTARHVGDPATSRYRWVMLAGLCLVYGAFGLITSGIAPVITPIREDLGISKSAMGLILGAWPLVYIGAAIPSGAFIDRFGLPRALALGISLIALSGLLRAVAGNAGTLFLAVGVFGLGGPLISVGAPKLISIWFPPRERGTAVGIYIAGNVTGNIIGFATANSVFMPLYDQSWRLTLGTYAGFAGLAAMAWLLIARDVEQPSDGAGPRSSVWKDFPRLLRIPTVQLLLVISVGVFLLLGAFNNWLPEILRAGGMTASEAGLWAALSAGIGIAGVLVIPRFATAPRRIRVSLGCFLTMAASGLLIGSQTFGLVLAGLVLLGIVRTSMLPVTILALMDAPQVGPKNMGAAGGLFFTTGEIGGVLGPFLIGLLADVTGGFWGGLVLLTGVASALSVLTIALGFTIRREQKRMALQQATHAPT